LSSGRVAAQATAAQDSFAVGDEDEGGRDDEIALLYAWRTGDREAGDRLLRAYYPKVTGFFRLRLPASADDLTQRTFLACTEARDRVEASSFRAYLFGIARNMLLKQLSSDRRDEHLADFDAPQPQSLLTPSGVIALRQEHWLLLRALDRLAAEVQVVLALFYVQDLRAREIGDVLGVPTSTVTTRLARAREALRHEVETLRAPARIRELVLADLDVWARSLGPLLNCDHAPAGLEEPGRD
jgi:RNA polymerase sigma-70 factor, ECF subfamily